jgi:uncharacterized protein (UPF0332 family)
MESARRSLADARLLHAAGSVRGAVNRAYYAMFYAASALAIAGGQSFSKHSALISYIHREFVKPGILPQEQGRALQKGFEDRTEGDYQDLVKLKPKDAAAMIQAASEFIAVVVGLSSDAVRQATDG